MLQDNHADMHIRHRDADGHHEYYWLNGKEPGVCVILSLTPHNFPGLAIHFLPNREAIAECKRLLTEGWGAKEYTEDWEKAASGVSPRGEWMWCEVCQADVDPATACPHDDQEKKVV